MTITTLQGNPIARLKDGQSILFETSREGRDNTLRELKLKCLDHSVHHGGHFEVRPVVGGVRVWRLKPENAPVRIEKKKVAPPPPISKETELPKPKVQKKNAPAPVVEPAKTCSRCKESKALDQFPKCSASRDGRGWYCKKCNAEYGKEWQANKKKKITSVEVRMPVGPGEEKSYAEIFKGDEKVASAVYTMTDYKKKTKRPIPVPYVEPEALTLWSRLKRIVGL